ncbi:L-lactate dehydrogenase, partial [Candidatus Micrarchaeota archaeon CG1_02_55_22]
MPKIAIVGAGFVGSTTAYALLLQGVAREIVLVDVNGEKAKGEAMDLEHGLQFLPAAKVSYSSDYSACKDADIVVVCAGANQKPGETRLDLTKKNAAIFRGMIPKIAKAAPNTILLIITNPVDVLTRLSLKLSKFPPSRVIGSGTTLDTARLRCLIGKHYGLHPSSVHAYILGEHGDSSFPAWSTASIGGIDLKRYPEYDRKKLDVLYQETRKAAYEIISRKGATYYAIGIAVSMLC